MKGQNAELDWTGTVPVSRRFDDPYYSLENGLDEARHVFLSGNGLPGRFRPGFRIAELGFGTGLNMLAAWAAYRDTGLPGSLDFTSFEAFPMDRADMARALAAFPDLAELAADFLDAWPGPDTAFELDGLTARVCSGDARRTLPGWAGHADAWFLDGFAPAKNPEMWEPALMKQVAAHTASDGMLATYSAAGDVRRALADAGFAVTRRPGFGRKRHMTCAVLA